MVQGRSRRHQNRVKLFRVRRLEVGRRVPVRRSRSQKAGRVVRDAYSSEETAASGLRLPLPLNHCSTPTPVSGRLDDIHSSTSNRNSNRKRNAEPFTVSSSPRQHGRHEQPVDQLRFTPFDHSTEGPALTTNTSPLEPPLAHSLEVVGVSRQAFCTAVGLHRSD